MSKHWKKVKTRLRVLFIFSANFFYLCRAKIELLPRDAPRGKRVLVVGTGPSAERLNEEMISKYDSVYLINHAIKNPIFAASKNHLTPLAWYSADVDRFNQLFGYLRSRPDVPRIFAPFMDSAILFAPLLRNDNSYLIVKVMNYSLIHFLYLFLQILFAGYYPGTKHESVSVCALSYLSDENKPLPVMGYSSALSLCLFLAKIGYHSIDLIGCDFSSGRSAIHVDLGSANFGDTDTSERFKLISSSLKEKGINLQNLSWIQ